PPADMYAFRDRVLHEPLPAMTRDEVPAWLTSELGRAMSKLPADRHVTALDFAESLRRGSLGLGPASGPAAPRQQSTVHAGGLPAAAWPVATPPRYVPESVPSADPAPPSSTSSAVPSPAVPSPGASSPSASSPSASSPSASSPSASSPSA